MHYYLRSAVGDNKRSVDFKWDFKFENDYTISFRFNSQRDKPIELSLMVSLNGENKKIEIYEDAKKEYEKIFKKESE